MLFPLSLSLKDSIRIHSEPGSSLPRKTSFRVIVRIFRATCAAFMRTDVGIYKSNTQAIYQKY
jgi:hypothetical protein